MQHWQISFSVELHVVEDHFLTYLSNMPHSLHADKKIWPTTKESEKNALKRPFCGGFLKKYFSGSLKDTYRGLQKINPQISIITPKLFDLHGWKSVEHGSLSMSQKALHADLSAWCVILKRKADLFYERLDFEMRKRLGIAMMDSTVYLDIGGQTAWPCTWIASFCSLDHAVDFSCSFLKEIIQSQCQMKSTFNVCLWKLRLVWYSHVGFLIFRCTYDRCSDMPARSSHVGAL